MKKILASILLALLVILCCTAVFACENEKIDEYEFTHGDKVYVLLPGSKVSDIPYEFYPLRYDNEYAEFYLDDYMRQTTCNRVVTYTMQILDEIKPDHKCVIYVSRYLKTVLDYEADTMYLSELDLKTMDHLINTVTVAFGGKLPYGLVYGVAKQINDKYNWRLPFAKVNDDETAAYLAENPEAVHLQATDFYPETGKNVESSKKAALSFSSFLESKQPLISFCKSIEYGDAQLTEYKNLWAKNLGVTATEGLNCAFSFIDGDIDEIIVRSPLFDLAIPIDFEDYFHEVYNNNYGLDEMYGYEKSYAGMKPYLSLIFADIEDCHNEMAAYCPQRKKPIIHFIRAYETFSYRTYCGCPTLSNIQYIYIWYSLNVDTGTFIFDARRAYVDALSEYLRIKYNRTEVFNIITLNELVRKHDIKIPQSDYSLRRDKFLESKFPDITLTATEDYYGFGRLVSFANAYLYNYEGDQNFDYTFGFAVYIAEQYGFESLCRLAMGESLYDVFGEKQVYEEFIAYITELFGTPQNE